MVVETTTTYSSNLIQDSYLSMIIVFNAVGAASGGGSLPSLGKILN